ncbi:MAG: hypothetical protein JXR10_02770 [Cyclobacteriaceae bacterium]
MDKERLKKANEKFDAQKESLPKKKEVDKPKEKTGKSSKEAFRRNLGCGG